MVTKRAAAKYKVSDENGGKSMSEKKSRVEKIIWRLGRNTGSRENNQGNKQEIKAKEIKVQR